MTQLCPLRIRTWQGDGVRKFQLIKHADTMQHECNVTELPRKEILLKRTQCPTEHEFTDAINRRTSGSSFRKAPSRSREQKMLFCLGEALKDENIKVINGSWSIALSQDLQGNLMSLRFAACGQDLTVTTGLVGFMKTKLGAIEEAKTTKKLAKTFFTHRRGAPKGWIGPRNELRKPDLKVFKQKVEP